MENRHYFQSMPEVSTVIPGPKSVKLYNEEQTKGIHKTEYFKALKKLAFAEKKYIKAIIIIIL